MDSILNLSTNLHSRSTRNKYSSPVHYFIQTFQDLVENMDDLGRKKLLSDVAERMPGVVLNLIEQQSSGPPPVTHPPASTTDPDWCICGNCREMPTDAERLCCRQVPQRCIATLAVSAVVCSFQCSGYQSPGLTYIM